MPKILGVEWIIAPWPSVTPIQRPYKLVTMGRDGSSGGQTFSVEPDSGK